MAYSIAQLQQLLIQAGCPSDKVVILAAIGMAESSGNPNAVNNGTGTHSVEYSVGLWQINTLAHKNYSVAQLKDPRTNAQEAVRILRVQGLRAWGAYTDGRYLKYMAASRLAAGGGSSPVPSNGATDNSSTSGDDDSSWWILLGIAALLLI